MLRFASSLIVCCVWLFIVQTVSIFLFPLAWIWWTLEIIGEFPSIRASIVTLVINVTNFGRIMNDPFEVAVHRFLHIYAHWLKYRLLPPFGSRRQFSIPLNEIFSSTSISMLTFCTSQSNLWTIISQSVSCSHKAPLFATILLRFPEFIDLFFKLLYLPILVFNDIIKTFYELVLILVLFSQHLQNIRLIQLIIYFNLILTSLASGKID